jgi:hypothetical protein
MPAWQMGERAAAMATGQHTGHLAGRIVKGDAVEQQVLDAWPEHDRVAWCDDMIGPSELDAAWQQAGEPGLVVVDYLGLMAWEGHDSARAYERASMRALQVKAFAKRRRVILLAACQVGRAGGGAGASRPSIDDLRDSGVIEETADRVLMFWRDSDDDQGLVVEVQKNRRGYLGHQQRLVFGPGRRLRERTEIAPPAEPAAAPATVDPDDSIPW